MATLTLKNVPDELYAALKAAAARNRRSLNQEAISRLERASLDFPARDADEPFEQYRQFWERIPAHKRASLEEMESWKREGRP